MPGRAVDHEQALEARGVRKGLGAYYTPPDVVDGLLDLVLEPLLSVRAEQGPDEVAAVRVLDPACGTGNFLVAAARRVERVLLGLGCEPDEAARRAVRCVRGIEIDPATARVCRSELRAIHPDGGGRTIVRGDALLDAGLVPAGGFDLVVGNPPFLSQLASTTARSRADAEALRTRFGGAVGPYTDPAAVFLLAALEAARPDGGTVALIEPVAVVSARDARGVRDVALRDASLVALWVADEVVFDADVEVCAPVLVRGARSGATAIVRGRRFEAGPSTDAPTAGAVSWSALLAALQDLPARDLRTDGVLGDLASATADFRDQYYGLAPHVIDQAEGGPTRPPLVTSGLIDPAVLAWGRRTTRFNKVTYRQPRVDLAALPAPLRAWAEGRLVPKVLLATQTRVLEAVVDADGDLLPSVPVISVVAPPEHLWRIGAVLTCPAVTLEAARRHLGSGRNARALRLRAQEVLALPLPADRSAWDDAAALLRSGAPLTEVGRRMDEAYGLVGDEELLAWWTGLLPVSAAPRPAAPPAS